jgi:hypothetical protein
MENTALWHVPVGTVSKLDGASPHISHYVHAFLDREFPDHWIGSGGPIPCSPRSPDLTPLDILFWGFVKDVAYCEKVQDVNELHDRINKATEYVTSETAFQHLAGN